MRKIIGWLGVAIFIAVNIAGIFAFFITSANRVTNVMYDGFGRMLSESPFLVRMILGQERLWAGWFWCIADLVIYFGGTLIAYGLVIWGFEDADTGTEKSDPFRATSG